jgi:hypothetical protein
MRCANWSMIQVRYSGKCWSGSFGYSCREWVGRYRVHAHARFASRILPLTARLRRQTFGTRGPLWIGLCCKTILQALSRNIDSSQSAATQLRFAASAFLILLLRPIVLPRVLQHNRSVSRPCEVASGKTSWGHHGTQSLGCAGQTVRPSLHSISQTSAGNA